MEPSSEPRSLQEGKEHQLRLAAIFDSAKAAFCPAESVDQAEHDYQQLELRMVQREQALKDAQDLRERARGPVTQFAANSLARFRQASLFRTHQRFEAVADQLAQRRSL